VAAEDTGSLKSTEKYPVTGLLTAAKERKMAKS
jgi:hypothetical protein